MRLSYLHLVLLIALFQLKPLQAQVVRYPARSADCSEQYFLQNFLNPKEGYKIEKMVVNNSGKVFGALQNIVFCMDESGQILWSKVIKSSNFLGIVRSMISLKDGNILVLSKEMYSSGLNYFSFIKISPEGNILFSKSYLHELQATEWAHLAEAEDGSLVVLGKGIEGGLSFHDQILLHKLDKNGDHIYLQSYACPPLRTMDGTSIQVIGKDIFITGNHHSFQDLKEYGILLKVSLADGSLQFSKGLFRPIILGAQLDRYELSVYNRNGNLAFHSSDPLQGWDGKIGGKQQDTGGYAWICRYRVAGNTEEFRKGMIMLLR